MRKRTYVLDSYARLACFQAEPGSEKVRELPRQARAGEVSAVMITINWCPLCGCDVLIELQEGELPQASSFPVKRWLWSHSQVRG